MSREAFLQRVREAVRTGNKVGVSAELPRRGGVAYQGAVDPVLRFRDECTAAGGQVYLVPEPQAALTQLLELVRGKRHAMLGRGPFIDSLELSKSLTDVGIEVILPGTAVIREACFQADLGVTGADYLIAETGSIALLARPEEPRSFSLLPPHHVILAHRRQILPDLFDLFEQLTLPSCLSLITGPSKTGDIELKLVTGVHGPGEVHVILVTEEVPGLQSL